MADEQRRDVPDLRMPLLGAAAWLGGLAAHLQPGSGLRAVTGSVAGFALAGASPGRAGEWRGALR